MPPYMTRINALKNRWPVGAGLYVNADDRLADVAGCVKAGVAEPNTELVFALGVKAAMTFEAGGIFRLLVLFAGVNFGMDLKRNHFNSPGMRWATVVPEGDALGY